MFELFLLRDLVGHLSALDRCYGSVEYLFMTQIWYSTWSRFPFLRRPPAPTYYPAYNSNARPCLSQLTVPASPFLAVGMDLFPRPWPVPRAQTLTNLNHCRPTAGHGVARNIRPKASLLTGLVQGKTQLIILEQSKYTWITKYYWNKGENGRCTKATWTVITDRRGRGALSTTCN